MDNLLYFGVNATWEHQRIIRKLTGELHRLYTAGQISLEPFAETMIDSGQTSEVPDIMLVDSTEKVYLVVEITTTKGLKRDIKKVNSFFADYEVSEGLVYDYNAKKWYKYQKDKGEITQNQAFSDTIGFDLDTLLQQSK
jgi:Uma2 family endonuclease